MMPRRKSKDQPLPPTPLDTRKRALQEEEAKLRAEIARKQKMIEEAPRRAAEAARRRQEEFIQRKSRTEARFGSPAALRDPRFGYELNAGAPARQKTLRKHRNQGMFTFFLLLLVLAGVIAWLYFKVIRGA